MSRRSLVAVAAMSLTVLTACGASAPPAKELAGEIVDTMDFGLDPQADADRIEEIRTCMKQAVADFQIDPNSGFSDFDDVAKKAADEQAQAIAIMGEFEQALADCTDLS